MNKERYLKVFRKELLCDKNKAKEICEDLMADIQVAKDNGESWEAVQLRLGSPKMLALEFNDNLEIQPKKSKFKLLFVVIALVIGLCVLAFFYLKSFIPETHSLGTSGYFKQSEIEEKTSEVIDAIGQRDYQLIIEMSNSKMKSVLTQRQFDEAIDGLGELGTFEKITHQIYVELTQNEKVNATGEIVANYKKRSVTYTISFDQEMKLSGLYMK